ncbi:unnamed protein product [Alternaria alternata]
MEDPSITPGDFLNYSYYLWIIQIVNLIGVAILKFSICAYLLALKFSRVYLGFGDDLLDRKGDYTSRSPQNQRSVMGKH